eukprot:c6674_g2_i1 orf=114-2273(-)
MPCVPSLGSESLVLDSCNRFYAGLDVTALIGPSTSKFDGGRLASKKQCNYIPSYLSTQQESTGNLSSAAGAWHFGSNALTWSRSPSLESVNGSYEQAFHGFKPSAKSVDGVKQADKPLKVHCLAGSKPFQQKGFKVKPSSQSSEEELAEYERVQHQSQVPCNSTDLSEEAKKSHIFGINAMRRMDNNYLSARSELFNHAVRSPHTSLQQSRQQQFSGVNPPSLLVDHGHAGSIMHSEQFVQASSTGKEPIWNQSFPRLQRASSNALNPSVDDSKQVLCQQNNSGINWSHHGNEVTDFQGMKEEDGFGRDAHVTNVCQPRGQLCNATQHLDEEDRCTRDKVLVIGTSSFSQRFSASNSYPPDTQLSGGMNGLSVNGFDSERQGYGIEYQSSGAQVLKLPKDEEMKAKESNASCKVAVVRMPAYCTLTHLQHSHSDIIFYLESLGADCSRIFRVDPTSMTCTVKQLRALVCALECHGIKWNDLGRIFNLCPKILHLKPETNLKTVTSFLFDEVGLPRTNLGKVIKRCPRLLVADINGQLWPTLSFLRSLGYSKMGHVISNNPTLLSFSVERKLIPKLRFLESLGFTYREAASMVVRFPAIFNYSVSENLQPKYDYLVHEMGGKNKDLLAFPQYFGYSLETRIRPRHECISRYEMSLSIQALLKLSDAEYNAKFSCGKGQSQFSKEVLVPPETNDVRHHDCGMDSMKFASFKHTETRLLVSV